MRKQESNQNNWNHNDSQRRQLKRCPTCARPGGHDPGWKCPAVTQNWVCNACGERGHTWLVCNRVKSTQNQWGRDQPNWKRRFNDVSDRYDDGSNERQADSKKEKSNVESGNEDYNEFNSLRLGRGKYPLYKFHVNSLNSKPPLLSKFSVNGSVIECEIDSGACITVFTKAFLDTYLNTEIEQMDSKKRFYNADGRECDVLGKINVRVNDKHDLQAVVLNSSRKSIPLIGRNWLDILSPSWREFFL